MLAMALSLAGRLRWVPSLTSPWTDVQEPPGGGQSGASAARAHRQRTSPESLKKDPRNHKNEARIDRKLFKNEAERSKVDKKISQVKQNGPKLEPRGAKTRSRSHKMAQDSAEEPPGRPNPGYPVQPDPQNGGQNPPKSTKNLCDMRKTDF